MMVIVDSRLIIVPRCLTPLLAALPKLVKRKQRGLSAGGAGTFQLIRMSRVSLFHYVTRNKAVRLYNHLLAVKQQ